MHWHVRYELIDQDCEFEIERPSRKLRDHVIRQLSPSSVSSPPIFLVHVARRVTREHTRPMKRSRTSFCPRSDNRSREQERRKQKLVPQLVPADHARTYKILFEEEEEESKIAHLRNSEYEKQNAISMRSTRTSQKFATTSSRASFSSG